MSEVPKSPFWIRWSMRRLLSPAEFRLVMDELEELHAHWRECEGPREAERRYRRQLRQYPLRLLSRRISRLTSSRHGMAPGRGLIHTARSLARVPMLSLSIVATVGVGIGGCTAIFAVMDVLFIRPLPYPDADRLVWISIQNPQTRYPFSVVDFQALTDQQSSFDGVAAFAYNVLTARSDDGGARVPVASVTPGYLELFGIDPIAGRAAAPEEGRPGSEATIVITRGFASRHMDASGRYPGELLGQVVRLSDVDYRVIGVVPDDFGPLVSGVEAFPTLILGPPTRRGPFFLSVFGRVKVGADPSLVAEELQTLNRRLFPLWADSYQDQESTWGMEPLEERLRGDADRILLVLMGSVGLLLLTATANAANLLLARIGGRRRELAVRSAMGASRGRLMSHLLMESALLAVGGVGLGLFLAHWGIALLPVVASDYIPRVAEASLSGPVLLFALGLASVCGLLFGLTSAFQGSAGELSPALRAGGRTATQCLGQQRAQRALVVGQLTVVVPLLAGAALLLTSFSNLSQVDPGFDPERLVSVNVPLSQNTYPGPAARTLFWDQIQRRVQAIPGVQALGVASGRPPNRPGMTNNFDLVDKPTPPESAQPAVPWLIADNQYFQALGIPLLEGRWFEVTDTDQGAPPVILVDEAWADRFFPEEDVVGRRLVSGGCTACPLTTVVGVVGAVPYSGVRRVREGSVYSPGAREFVANPFLHVRVQGDPEQIVPRIREEIRSVDQAIPLTDFATGEVLLRDSLRQPRHLSFLLGSFSLVALTLAVLGLYGIVSYSVHRRQGDIAVRLALGGAPKDVWLMVVRQGMSMVFLGLVLGSLVALGFTRVLSDLLFEVQPGDPLILLAVGLLLAAVSTVACAVPGRRAVRMDPVTVLKEE